MCFARDRRCRAHCDVLFISQLVTILPHRFVMFCHIFLLVLLPLLLLLLLLLLLVVVGGGGVGGGVGVGVAVGVVVVVAAAPAAFFCQSRNSRKSSNRLFSRFFDVV